MSKREHQLSVPVDRELREAVECAASREDRTVANWVRRVIAQAARTAQAQERAA